MKSNLRRKSFALVATAAMLVASFFVVQHARGESAKPSAPGTYHYFCSIHPKMTAEVVVK